eukprot:CAMPEP_0203909432 /NCGR_PEP_ID=MMETSP0359-20131031/50739_1 /ASSEMBLY_ACC=CAM_ASM_000338 /TAXON_ID=268821 /ORGANISM="Scrippsiella Hangoei, Strain SHTV-5" /LENGTH=331 /DNA_ID=CAMNT_0050834669 /DNA_START=103 /DNA_END=1102 /DNA_ORIENTATION=-
MATPSAGSISQASGEPRSATPPLLRLPAEPHIRGSRPRPNQEPASTAAQAPGRPAAATARSSGRPPRRPLERLGLGLGGTSEVEERDAVGGDEAAGQVPQIPHEALPTSKAREGIRELTVLVVELDVHVAGQEVVPAVISTQALQHFIPRPGRLAPAAVEGLLPAHHGGTEAAEASAALQTALSHKDASSSPAPSPPAPPLAAARRAPLLLAAAALTPPDVAAAAAADAAPPSDHRAAPPPTSMATKAGRAGAVAAVAADTAVAALVAPGGAGRWAAEKVQLDSGTHLRPRPLQPRRLHPSASLRAGGCRVTPPSSRGSTRGEARLALARP